MAGIRIFSTAVAPEWIDYNGHLRDAYYTLILSLATDALMDRVGLDAEYRARTRCTLYTLELHLYFLHEVRGDERVEVDLRLLAVDAKRIHAAFELAVARVTGPVATGEMLLLHVEQGDEPKSAPFPVAVRAALDALELDSRAMPAAGPGSRAMGLVRR
jgi:acyl-CoA thioester hydrolase